MVVAECRQCSGQAVEVWQRKTSHLDGSSLLGIDIPGVDTLTSGAKAVFYVGIGTALIVGSMFVWRLIDTFMGD
jgi:hypothetical protein